MECFAKLERLKDSDLLVAKLTSQLTMEIWANDFFRKGQFDVDGGVSAAGKNVLEKISVVKTYKKNSEVGNSLKPLQKWVLSRMSKSCFHLLSLNPLSANPTKWSNTLKQFVGNLPTNYLSVFDHFVGLALKVLIQMQTHFSWFTMISAKSWFPDLWLTLVA